ncbi:ATP-binding protein [Comamonadaceae bacterium OTU4NAUVB1]|jgi:PAS domain S-box-containing protein|nr:ATP-binding protein [Comamonadaceae bacterium OTU4NAUVB1]HSU23208.1 ATP-binding protein [Variovorax sp.]
MTSTPIDPGSDDLAFLSGGGEMGDLMRRMDWRGHPLGAPTEWPQSLRSMVSACLNSPVLGTVLWGPDLRMLYNDAYIPSMVERHPLALGRPVADVWGEAWAAVAPDFHRVVATGVGMMQRRVPLVIRRHGHDVETWWDFTATPIRGEDGRIAGLFNQGTEVTEQVVAEMQRDATAAELRALTRHLAMTVEERTRDRNALWELSSDLMLRCGFDGRIVAVNPAWLRLLGWRDDELLGTSLFELIHPDDLQRTIDGANASAEGRSFQRFDNRFRHKDGSHRHISWSTRSANGLINAVGRDVTEELAQSSALAASQEQLRQSQKLEAVGQLTGGVAHDFNNLLTVVRSSVELLRRVDAGAVEKRRRYIQSISDAVDRAAKLTGQLLAFARRQALVPTVFDVVRNIRMVGEMMDTLTGSRIRVRIDLPPHPCFVHADASQFDTAIINMAVNARDAMGGEGTLSLRVRRVEALPAIRSHPVRPGAYVEVSLADTGTGIPTDHLKKIFEPFFTTKSVGLGTGLGLSQVYGFAKQSGGEVQVDSTPGRGSTFTLYLPWAHGEGAAQEADVPEMLLTGHGTRVLVVEDNVEVGALATQTLAELGYVTAWAVDATQALAELDRAPDAFDVVFSDVVMPGMNGVELAREIARRHPDVPVVLTSGYSDALVHDGTSGFELLQKPYSFDQLSLALRKETAKRHRRRSGAA